MAVVMSTSTAVPAFSLVDLAEEDVVKTIPISLKFMLVKAMESLNAPVAPVFNCANLGESGYQVSAALTLKLKLLELLVTHAAPLSLQRPVLSRKYLSTLLASNLCLLWILVARLQMTYR
uniref:Uncharacterized protein n=1 Tax=Arundo donax TaxID=35708 RepID=A0A0A8YHJ7_ARUDO